MTQPRLSWIWWCLLLSSMLAASGLQAQRDGAHPYASAEPITVPRLFAPEIMTTELESGWSFSPDGRTVYFTVTETAQVTGDKYLSVLVESHHRNGRWSTPEILPFSGQYQDRDAFITPDGTRMFFCSTRPIEGSSKLKKDWDIWVVDRTAGGWGEPRRLPAPVNSDEDELYTSLAHNGTLYFGSAREGGLGGWDLYRARLVNGVYPAVENLGTATNTPGWEFNPWVVADESMLLFSGQARPGAHGRIDLYVSHIHAGVLAPAKNLGPNVNGPLVQYHPGVTPDGKYLVYYRAQGFADPPLARPIGYEELVKQLRGIHNHAGNLHQIELRAADLEQP